MRQTISGWVAAIAVVAASAAPAMACGGGLFQSESYVSPCGQAYIPAPPPVYSGCNSGCGGWGYERLPDPVHQYYYADQGPTYTGPGEFAPYPAYQEDALPVWGAYRHHPYYSGYDGGRYAVTSAPEYDGAGTIEGPAFYGYRTHPHFRPWRHHGFYRYHQGAGVRYGYAPRHGYAPRYSLPPRQFYAQHHNLRYGTPAGEPHRYGQREHTHAPVRNPRAGVGFCSAHQAEPGGADIERQHRGVGDVEALDLAGHVEPRHHAAGLARQLPQALAFGAQHQRQRLAQLHRAEIIAALRCRARRS
jgi:hypothetical protein